MANRNRRAGHSWERECVKILVEFFPDVVTSRAESRNRDDQKVDLCYTGFLNVQSEMPDEEGQMNVIFDKKTRKTPKGRFVTEGIYVHLKLEDFVELIRKSC